jgi:group I intron endonuclease
MNTEFKKHYVYVTTNLVNDKQYVGDHTINNKSFYYLGSGKLLKSAVKIYGCENFFKEILEWFDTREEAAIAQEKYIRLFNTHVNDGGYNLTYDGGRGGVEFWNDDYILNLRYKNKGTKNPMFGKKHSQETINKIKKANSGKRNFPTKNLGRKLSEEHKQHISEGGKGKKLSEMAKINMAIARLNVVYERISCPFCNKTGIISNMKRWHFDHCKFNPNHIKPKNRNLKKVECPHCNKVGTSNLMHRYHFANCKFRHEINIKNNLSYERTCN